MTIPKRHHLSSLYYGLITIVIVSGCAAPPPSVEITIPASVETTASDEPTITAPVATPAATDTPQPSFTPEPVITASHTPTPVPPEWTGLLPGMGQRFINVPIPDKEGTFSRFYALRLDPALIAFEVYYNPPEPRMIDEWLAFTGSEVVINAGFFGGDNHPVGRVVVDGEQFGFPLIWVYGPESVGVSGIFAVNKAGEPGIHIVGREGYNPDGLRFEQAIESYPVLLLPGNQPVFNKETNNRSRRTVIGIDHEGQVIILLIDQPIFSLYELSHWLAEESDLRLDMALNLDGGRSSGLGVNTASYRWVIPSYVPLPVVLMAYPKPG